MRSTPAPSDLFGAQTLTVPEVMTALRMSRHKVYDLIRTKKLKSFTEGRCRRIPADALSHYIHMKLEEAA